MNEVFELESFQQQFETFEPSEKRWIELMKTQLHRSLDVGKPLTYWLREKKLVSKRLYFAVNAATRKVLVLAFTHKKEQQKTIAIIRLNKEQYLDFLR